MVKYLKFASCYNIFDIKIKVFCTYWNLCRYSINNFELFHCQKNWLNLLRHDKI